MNEKTKNILKLIGIWYGIVSILTLIVGYLLYTGSDNLKTIGGHLEIWKYAILNPILLPFFACLIFSQTIITLFLLFKKIKNINCRIFLIALLIPLTNLIFFVIENFYNGMGFLSMAIGAYALFILLPLIFIVTLCTPIKLLPLKWEIIKTSIVTSIIGWILVILSTEISSGVCYIIRTHQLKKYEPLIQSIEKLKIQNGTYPHDIDRVSKIKNDTEKYPHYEYVNYDDNFILKIHTSKFEQYHYCSDQNLEECQSGWHNYRRQTKYGKWTRSAEDFD